MDYQPPITDQHHIIRPQLIKNSPEGMPRRSDRPDKTFNNIITNSCIFTRRASSFQLSSGKIIDELNEPASAAP